MICVLESKRIPKGHSRGLLEYITIKSVCCEKCQNTFPINYLFNSHFFQFRPSCVSKAIQIKDEQHNSCSLNNMKCINLCLNEIGHVTFKNRLSTNGHDDGLGRTYTDCNRSLSD